MMSLDYNQLSYFFLDFAYFSFRLKQSFTGSMHSMILNVLIAGEIELNKHEV